MQCGNQRERNRALQKKWRSVNRSLVEDVKADAESKKRSEEEVKNEEEADIHVAQEGLSPEGERPPRDLSREKCPHDVEASGETVAEKLPSIAIFESQDFPCTGSDPRKYSNSGTV